MASAGPASGAPDLRLLLGDVDRFVAETFGRAPALHRADGAPPRLPLTLDDVDQLVTGGALRAPAFRLVKDGATLPRRAYTRTGRIGGTTVTDLADAGRVLELVGRGATLVLQGLHRSWPAVTQLCRALEDLLTHPVQANAYLTPPSSRGLDVHHDTHDVLALQLAGSKHWVVHEPAVVAPLPSQPWSSDRHVAGAVVLDTELHTGDALYLPRGTPHAAGSTTEVSLHLTIGIRPVTWFDVLQRAVRSAADEPAWRQSLPAGFADDPADLAGELAARLEDASRWLTKRDPRELADEVVAGFRRQQLPRLEGQLGRLLELDRITADTPVRRRPGVPVRTRTSADGRVELHTSDRTVAFPAAVGPELEQLLSGREVVARDLTRLDADSRLVLVRRLVREGLLEEHPERAGGGVDRSGA